MIEAIPDGLVEDYEPLIDGLTGLRDPEDRHVVMPDRSRARRVFHDHGILSAACADRIP
jgi:hypothetical protein